MLKKGTKIYSIITGCCPKCHQESMYSNKNAYIISDTLKINERCSKCDTKYRIEPSFFYGAMYVSYAVGIAFAVAAYVISNLFFNASLQVTFISIVGTLVVFMPIIMRLSRNIWINFFMHYDESLVKK
ncbi:DUF983 domain-containing protein [Seonamhaeicola sediminis]|uniref:DUF983 domain-containing protein n=1 Tax=Seonamhaeicola sediminis TaxID=2528206 RepID=A0A562YGC6_9FLAO|nr:DUF983 domain-containing protein [Seonamhaeicola sediminis]TWO33452.1 DUF983 domain-containing protein [Seonamhaeicola sediminis]